MKRQVGVLSALAVVAANVGIATPAFSQTAASVTAQCEIYRQMGDRAALQAELATLLAIDPTNVCIDVIVDILGGSPVAQVVTPQVY